MKAKSPIAFEYSASRYFFSFINPANGGNQTESLLDHFDRAPAVWGRKVFKFL
jgi:hypothetical protein